MVLVGIGTDDTPADRAYIVKKILNLRLFSEFEGPGQENKAEGGGAMWKQNVMDIQGEILCVSQFTLMARTEKGTKPDFHGAMSTIPGNAFYSTFLEDIGKAYNPDRIKDGRFGAMMQVSLTNDGPVTITIDSKSTSGKSSSSSPNSGSTSQATSRSQTPVASLTTAASPDELVVPEIKELSLEEKIAAKAAAREKKRAAATAYAQRKKIEELDRVEQVAAPSQT